MKTLKVLSVVGARPNFMKIAPFVRAVRARNEAGEGSLRIDHVLVHTGQHYDVEMSRAFFEALDIPEPDVNLEVGSGSHAEQVGRTMMELEKVLKERKPDWVVVVGDVNATCAASITAKKEWVRCAHIEAGLRSGDWTMPEEVNRVVTDRLSDLLLTPCRFSTENLEAEGAGKDRIRLVGNIMIDTLESQRLRAEELDGSEVLRENLWEGRKLPSKDAMKAFEAGDFALMTLHRPSNVDDPAILGPLVSLLTDEASRRLPLLWPVHPRSVAQLKRFGLWNRVMEADRLVLLRPLGYRQLLKLNMEARIMLTDSGGLQEECCVLGTPCLTLRWNTERPATLREHGGTCVLVGNDVERVREELFRTVVMERKPARPELWDGRTAARAVEALVEAEKNLRSSSSKGNPRP